MLCSVPFRVYSTCPLAGPLIVTEAELPPQTTVLPEIEAVGKAFTFTVAEPFNPLIAEQFASFNVLKLYVAVAPGVTETTAGLLEAEND